MKYRSVLSPDARADIRSAVRWYQRIDPNLAFRFKVETLATRWRIERFPFQFPLIKNTARRALLKRFPYSIYFNLNDDEVSVIAVVHQRRSDNIWMDRIKAKT
jgi:plasmid stabilization system protein ParE